MTRLHPFLRQVFSSLLLVCAGAMLGGAAPSTNESPLVSGEAIPVGAGVLRGRMAVGISTEAIGVVGSSGVEGSDIFTIAGTHSTRPGLYLYHFVARADTGAPVFGNSVEVELPTGKGKVPPPGAIFQSKEGVVHGFWLRKNEVLRTIFDPKGQRFVESPAGAIAIEGMPRNPSWLGVLQEESGAIELLLGINDGTPQRPTDAPSWRDPAYRPFDGAGVYRGGWPYVFMYGARIESADAAGGAKAKLITPTQREALLNYGNITAVDLGSGRQRDVITGTWFGNLLYYHNAAASGVELQPQRLVTDEAGIAHHHLSIRPSPVAYPNAQSGLMSDLIVGGEGALYYYRFTGRFTAIGAPIYADPYPVLEQDAKLYPGSLPVINAVDWDGNGALDVVAGNSEGRVLFFRNAGSNAKPAFQDSIPLYVGNRPIQIHPGYHDVQGPQEAPWGYASPCVVDWNGDGLPDILMSSATARHEVFLNIGSRTQPKLDLSAPLFCRGLDLHGTWRVKPGGAKLGQRMAYVALDDDDEFHLYWQIDVYNLEDGGKLHLKDGKAIRANFLAAGGTGRSKIVLTDWDRDGKLDLLVGTPRHGSIPNPEKGLPQSKGLKGAAIVFMKNVGSNEQPVFAFPTLMQFRGNPIYLGQHECSPAVWDIGQADGPDLLAGNQDGRIMYYARRDLSWMPISE